MTERPTNNFHGRVRDAGGGVVDILVDRDTFVYPPIGAGVWVVLDDPQWNLEGGAFRTLCRVMQEKNQLRSALETIHTVLINGHPTAMSIGIESIVRHALQESSET